MCHRYLIHYQKLMTYDVLLPAKHYKNKQSQKKPHRVHDVHSTYNTGVFVRAYQIYLKSQDNLQA